MIQTVSIAALRNHSLRPRRPEALKGKYLRESLRNNWRIRKNSLGYTKLTESEFARVLLDAAHHMILKSLFTASIPCSFESPCIIETSSATVQHQYKQSLCILKRKENLSMFIQKIEHDLTVRHYNL